MIKAVAVGALLIVAAASFAGDPPPPMTREELEACLADDAALREKSTALTARKEALNAELDALKALETRIETGKTTLEILVDASRPDDREVAERVVNALDKLGLVATIAAVPAPELARRIDAGACDLYVGQLAATVSATVPRR